MHDAPHQRTAADPEPPTPSESELLVALAESETEADAGLFVPGETVRRRLLDSTARLQTRAAGQVAMRPPRVDRPLRMDQVGVLSVYLLARQLVCDT
jgi:hypothetical protein